MTAEFDPYGRLIRVVTPRAPFASDDEDARSWHFGYDFEDRPIWLEGPPDRAGGPRQLTRITYDEVGNVRTVTTRPDDRVTLYEYDERDALIQVTWPSGMVVQYAYDDLGNLSEARLRRTPTAAEEVVSYAFDGLSRPRAMTRHPSGNQAAEHFAFAYDADGNCSAYQLATPR
jgi:YD repeat-containing protein